MLTNLLLRINRSKTASKVRNYLSNKIGASNVEIIVWISVVLVIATVLFLFKDAVVEFVNNAIGEVKNLKVK